MFQVISERESSTEAVALRWDSNTHEVDIVLVDKAAGVSYQQVVPPEKAADAFDHPFAYCLA